MTHATALPAEVVHHDIGFQPVVAQLSHEIPEVAAHQEGIVARGEELIDEFGLKPEFLEDGAHALFFSAIAQRYDDLEQRKDTLSVDEYTREKEFIADATVLLALGSSEYYDEMKPLIDTNNKHETEYEEVVYDKFTNVPVSKELARAIHETDLLAGVKGRLGVTAENEDPFEVRVMNISDETTLGGMHPSMPKALENEPYNSKGWRDFEADTEAFKEYAEGLQAGAKQFREALDFQGRIPGAWVADVKGVKTLVISLPFAEKILYKDETRASYYSEDDWDRDFAVLEHEYTHTQGGLNLGGNVFYGVAAEEKRAERFSRDRNGYGDIKGADLDLHIVAGIDTATFMDSETKGGTAESFFTMIAKEVGLQTALEMALTVPSAYVEDEARPLQAHVARHLGGPDELTKRIYHKVLQDPASRAAMDERMDKFAKKIASMPSADYWAAYRRGMGLKFVTEKIEERVAAIQATH